MNPNRIETYINLIQQLLSTPTETRHQILAVNQDLLDPGLLQTIAMVAQTSAENGNQQTNEFLLTLAMQLSETLGVSITENPSPTATSLEYLKFLIHILQLTHESKGDPKTIYPILQDNLSKLDQGLVEMLESWATSTLAEVKPEAAHSIAADIVNFSNRIQEFTLGNKANNLEIAITGYETALTVYTPAAKPHQWVSATNNLATAYINRIYGDKSVNIEQAIAIYQQTLQSISPQDSPQYWAMTQNNLGNAYIRRLEGDKAQNIQEAIAAYQKALQVITQEKLPQQWATIQNNLGNTYLTKTTGNLGENIELAIDAYQQALQVITQKQHSLDWAITQTNLGNAYLNKITGNLGENIELAIDAYQQALQVITQENQPHQWGNIHKNLGTAYLNRVTGEVSKNIELAIAAYQQALKIITIAYSAIEWLMMSINLATAYLNIETAEAEADKNIELAIDLSQQALQVISREKCGLYWGIIQANLGDAYSRKVTENHPNFTQNIELAVKAYQAALQIFTPESYPLECLQISRKLGDLGFKQKNLQLAIEGYEVAIYLLEMTQSLAKTEAFYREILAASIYMYGNIVECYVNLGKYEQALEYLEASRCRRLVELMMINQVYQQEERLRSVEEYLRLQQEINLLRFGVTGVRKLMTLGSQFGIREIEFESQEKIALLLAKQQQVWQKIRSIDRVFAEQLQVTRLSFWEIQQLVKDEETAVLDFYSTRNHTYIFVLTQQQVTVHICQGESVENLQAWVRDKWLNSYVNNRGEWGNQMEDFLSEFAQRLGFNQLLTQLKEIQELVIIPHLYLHQIPFAAVPVFQAEKTKYFCDCFRLRVVSSCQILSYCSERSLPKNLRKIGIVENHTANLFYRRYECETLANMHLIPPQKRLQYSRATVENYRNFIEQVQVLHSSHFASTNIVNPLDSNLKLFDGEISIGSVFTWRLPELFDVFISSCEINFNQTEISDDFLTFATAFISAGARHVVSSLWLVEDLATALFCTFYYQHRQNHHRSEALQKAQNQLRYLTGTQLSSYKKQLEEYLKQHQKDGNQEQIKKERERLLWFCQQEFPFAHPDYWAGFISQGISYSNQHLAIS